MSKQGFSLIEWVVSFSLILLLLAYSFQFFVVIGQRIYKTSDQAYVCSELCSAFDTIVRSVYGASFEAKKWKSLKKGNIVWHDEYANVDIGCELIAENLFFVKGTFESNTWKKKRKNLIAKHVTHFTVIPHLQKGIIKSVHCIIAGAYGGRKYTFERTITIRNRYV